MEKDVHKDEGTAISPTSEDTLTKNVDRNFQSPVLPPATTTVITQTTLPPSTNAFTEQHPAPLNRHVAHNNQQRTKIKLPHFIVSLCLWFPVFLVVGYICYTYYVLVVVLCSRTLIHGDSPDIARGALYIAFFNVILLFLVPTYARLLFEKDPGWADTYKMRLSQTEEEEGQALRTSPSLLIIDGIVVLPRHPVGAPAEGLALCGRCPFLPPKPLRCHHCSTCSRCVLKMDHHCVWLNRCVAFRNYKYFIIFLFWSFVGCGLVFGALLQEMIRELVDDTLSGKTVQFLVVAVFALVFMLFTFSLLVYHMFLVSNNFTTLEQMDWRDAILNGETPKELVGVNTSSARPKMKDRPFNLGGWKNWKQVFGPNPLLWLLPIWSSEGTGLLFPTRPGLAPNTLQVDNHSSSSVSVDDSTVGSSTNLRVARSTLAIHDGNIV